jgi:hypothetical protein
MSICSFLQEELICLPFVESKKNEGKKERRKKERKESPQNLMAFFSVST